MTVYETLSLMIAFVVLVLTINSNNDKK
ncbi:putative holin-like toxin [Enterococcus sp. AZ194]